MSIRDDHEDDNCIQLTTRNAIRASDFENVDHSETEFQRSRGDDWCENPLVVGTSTLETQGDSPKCMYHLLSQTVPAKTPVDPRFSSDKPPRVRMILPELNRGTNCVYSLSYD